MRIVMNQPNHHDGAPIEVPGLGIFENGTSTEVDPDRLAVAIAGNQCPAEWADEEEVVFGDVDAELPPAPEIEEPEEVLPEDLVEPVAPDGGGE